MHVPGDRNSNIYKRYDDKYEVGYRDSTGTLRWPGPFDTIKQARTERDDLFARKGKGERIQPTERRCHPVATGGAS